MASTDAIQAIQSVLHSADADLSSVASRLNDEFRRLYPLRDPNSASSSTLNPLTLLTRLRALQSTLPSLRDELLSLHQQKADLAHLCHTQLSDLHAAALSLLPVAAPTLDATEATPARNVLYQQLSGTLREKDQELEKLLTHFLRAHGQFVSMFPALAPAVSADDLDLALLQAAAVNAPEHRRTLNEIDSSSNNKASDQSATPHVTPRGKLATAGKAASKPPSEKKRATQSRGSRAPSASSSVADEPEADEAFVPVDKKVYNRLPRILKIRAGKLAEINAFYEKVWNVLVGTGKPVPEKSLVEKVGEQDASMLQVLKGLAVLTLTNQGWMLTKQKKQMSKSSRGRS